MCHDVWLQQLEHGWVTWENDEAKLKFRWALIWHPAMTTTRAAATASPLPQKKQMWDTQAYNIPAKPGSKACQEFNQGDCSNGAAHPKDLHACSYCLGAVNGLFGHQEHYCWRKQMALAKSSKWGSSCMESPIPHCCDWIYNGYSC